MPRNPATALQEASMRADDWWATASSAPTPHHLGHRERLRQGALKAMDALPAYTKAALAHAPREQFRVLFLDKKNQLIADETMNEGTVDHAPVYPREVARRALELSASAVILVHNHPSGDPTPSGADIDMTRQVIEAGRVLKIAV